MRIDAIKNTHLKRAIRIAGIDDLKLITLTNNYQVFPQHNSPSDESKVLLVVMDYCSRLKTSKQNQKNFIFYEIQNDAFLLKTAQQQDRLIEKLQDEFEEAKAETDSEDLVKLATIVEFCNQNNIDLIPAFEHIYEQHPYFLLGATHEQVQKYITYFTENAIIYRLLEPDTARIYSDLGYRGINSNLCAAKS